MLSTIERDIYVIDKCYAKPIYYKQGTNAISLKFNFKDYTIPTGSVAKAYVNKPSGKATYSTATITEDNAVIVKPKTQMFSEDGKSGLHIKITKNEDVLMSFEYIINVEKNPIAGEVPPSENESDMMDSMLELLKIEVNKATLQAAQTVQAEGAKQVQAVQTAAQEIIADREQIQKNKADIASLTQNKADAIVNTVTGEHIAVGDSSGHLLENLRIFGKSKQVQTTGKNLFSVEMDKTQDAGSTYLYTLKLKPNMKYTLSCDVEKDTVASLYFTKTGTAENGVFKNTPRVITTGEDGTVKVYVRYNKEDGHGINLYQAVLEGKCYIQLEEGETATYPEPYTGGKPSPSPDWHQDVVSSGDNGKLEVNVLTKNLFNKDAFYNFFYEKKKDIFKEIVDGKEMLKMAGRKRI